jgi:hypothetical protein
VAFSLVIEVKSKIILASDVGKTGKPSENTVENDGSSGNQWMHMLIRDSRVRSDAA